MEIHRLKIICSSAADHGPDLRSLSTSPTQLPTNLHVCGTTREPAFAGEPPKTGKTSGKKSGKVLLKRPTQLNHGKTLEKYGKNMGKIMKIGKILPKPSLKRLKSRIVQNAGVLRKPGSSTQIP